MTSSDIAIVGMAIRCPGADNLSEFWANLVQGTESITFFEREELEPSAFLPVDPDHPDFIPASGVISDHDRFDAPFFGISRAEAEGMDPQHRIFLETAWEAIEDSGHDLTDHGGNVSVYAGSASNTYTLALMDRPGSALRSYQGLVGTEKDYLATRVSFRLGLCGESITVQSACSTSLVAVHLACQSLLTGQSDVAIAGGVSVQASQRTGFMFHEDAIFSPDGHCRAFDARARGTVFGNGVGVVVLRPLDDALADGDRIYAVIKGSFVNNDGNAKMSYTAPSVSAQAAVIAGALDFAEVSADTIGYVEAHGTGTVLGDPIEVEALTLAFRETTSRQQFCALGSVKPNVGHLNTAAGVTGLIKTALVLHHSLIPASINFSAPNPAIDFEGSPFYVNSELREWPAADTPRRAGVSSFGIGGTNAHAVLEEAPQTTPASEDDGVSVLAISARSESALRELAARHRDLLAREDAPRLADYAFTTNTGRRRFAHRLAVRTRTAEQAAEALGRFADEGRLAPGAVQGNVAGVRPPRLAFVYTGQSAAYPELAGRLYGGQPVFRAAVNRCATLLGITGAELLEQRSGALFAPTAVFAVQHALGDLYGSWGIRPDAVLGHSLGEVASASAAGILDLSSALNLVVERTRQLDAIPEGVMAAISAAPDEVSSWIASLSQRVAIAAVNGPEQVVVSGDAAAMGELLDRLEREGTRAVRLNGRTAFHSPLVDPAVTGLTEFLRGLQQSVPQIPFHSTLTGARVEEALEHTYWARQLRNPVLFADGIGSLQDAGCTIFLEIGPLPTLSALGAGLAPDASWIPSLRAGEDDQESVLDATGRLFAVGVPVHLGALAGPGVRRRVTVATYPFERQRYWIEDEGSTTPPAPPPPVAAPSPRPSVPVDRAVVLDRLLEAAGRILRADVADLDPDAPFVELGLDSLSMIEVVQEARDAFGAQLSVAELLGTVPSLAALADVVVERAPERPSGPEPQPSPGSARGSESVAPAPGSEAFAPGSVEQLMAEQLRAVSTIIAQQLDVLRGSGGPSGVNVEPARASTLPEPVVTVTRATTDPGRRAALDDLVARYTARTGRSKELAGRYRSVHADNDNRFVPEFRMDTKEIVYPIAVERSLGSRLWDVDGNEYVDLVMGMGVNLFGHSPRFVTDAVTAQLERGVHVGVQSELAGRLAELACGLTGTERIAFCNTGSEAVMTALRLARTVSGRSTVVVFSGSYHGVFDGTLVRRSGVDDARGVPLVAGVPPGYAEVVLVLDYDDPSSLEVIAARASELAAVLVEPVQSRRPDVQPREFLQRLREVTATAGIALVFDEMISGFRCDLGGAQAWAGVSADLVAYGKVLGGGLPIGAVAGRATYLDAIDGGAWNYGDGSYPRAGRTFFAGTFCKHPLAMSAAFAVLTELAHQGPELQRHLNERTRVFVDELNTVFSAADVPITVARFGSQFRFTSTADVHLLYPHLVLQGVHAREGRNFFLSTEHSDDDLQQVLSAVRTSLAQGLGSGLLPSAARPSGPPSGSSSGSGSASSPALPVTPGQRALLTLSRLDPGVASAYNQTAALRVDGALDLETLRRAARSVVSRHEALRTTFDVEAGTQTVHPSTALEVTVMDLAPDALDDHIATVGGRSFDLAAGPLVRFTVLRTSPESHVVVVGAHHLVADGWSMGVLLRDLGAAYAGVDLASAPSFADHVTRAAALAADPDDAAYWASLHHDPAPALELPTDRHRTRVRGHRGGRRSITLSAELSEAVRGLGATQGCTPFMVLLSAYELWLRRITGQCDLVVGVPVAGRDFAGGSTLVAPCASMLALRSRVHDDESFVGHLAAVRQRMVLAHEHQAYPLPLLIEALGRRPDLSRAALVETSFNLDPHVPQPALAGVALERLTVPVGHVQLDLSMNVVDDPQLRVEIDFSTELLDEDTAEAWLASYETLLGSIVATPFARVGGLTMLTASDRERCVTVGDPATAGPGSLYEAFEARVSRAPGATALIEDEASVTYAELAGTAEEVSARLLDLGAGPGALVGVLLPRSAASWAAVLGTLRCGAAFVPLDVSWPAERVRATVADAGVRVVIAATPVEHLPDGVTVLSTSWLGGGESSVAEVTVPPARRSPGDPLAVLYTSGSTGVPRGVVLSERALLNRLAWMWRTYPFGDDEVSAHKTSLSFVDALWEMFGALLQGVPSVVVDQDALVDSQRLVGLLADHRVTRLVVVPSLLRELLDTIARPTHQGLALRVVSTSGEPLPLQVRDRFFDVLPGVRLLNLYGSTEAMGDATAHECGPDDPAYVSVGRPVDGVSVYVLDPGGLPVPVGVPGELFVGGACVATGYLHRPAETADRFVPDLFGDSSGRRALRTGDRARWRADGGLELLGRFDSQVKIRGIRVEPSEVEEALQGLSGVAEAAVVAVPDGLGDPSLVAYVVGLSHSPRELRRQVAEALPAAAVPGRLVVVDRLPRTSTGKVDRVALADRPLPAPMAVTDREQTPVERAVRGLWADVLGREPASLDEDFADAGGSSLHAVRLQARVRDVFGVEVALRDLLATPTTAGIAATVLARRSATTAVPAEAIAPRPTGAHAPMSAVQLRLWFLHQLDPDGAAFHLPFSFRIRGPLDTDLLRACVASVQERHEVLRTTFHALDGEPVQEVRERVPPMATVDLSGLDAERSEQQLAVLLESEARRPFDLSTEPPFRATLVRVGEDHHVVLVTLHHIAADGWSLGLVLGEVAAAYTAGHPTSEPPSLQYADYAAWQQDQRPGPQAAAGLDFWRGALAGAPALLELPSDRPRATHATSPGDAVELRLGRELTTELKAYARSRGVTPFVIVLAAYACLLSRYTGETDLCIGTPVANRGRPETESMVGCFVNSLVIRVDLAGRPSFDALVDRVHETVTSALDHQDVPFERVVDELQPIRDTSYPPLFQVMAVLHTEPRSTPRIPGLETEAIGVHPGAATHDLTLDLAEVDGDLAGSIEYRTDLFDRPRMERVAKHLTTLLGRMLEAPGAPVDAVEILTRPEHDQVIREWNATDSEVSALLVHEQFAQVAEDTPDRVAVRTHEGDGVTYGELHRTSNRLARRLARSGVRPERVVGLVARRGVDYITALLAIAKAGGASLPLDPDQPAGRLREIVRDSGCALVLSDGLAPPEVGAVLLQDLIVDSQAEDGGDLPRSAVAENLAYVLYTSGSTGAPKGVQVEHRGMVNHVAAKLRDLDVGEDDVVAQNGPQSFDVSIWQCLAALTCGAQVAVLDDEIAQDPRGVLDAVEGLGITVLQVVPSFLRELVAEAQVDRPALGSLRWMVPTGDALAADLHAQWHALYPQVPVLNTYGATECSDDQCHLALWRPAEPATPVVSIGRPIQNMRAYVLDGELRPRPVGVPGELYLGGSGVGRGYLGRAALTAENFVPDPFGTEPGGRLYRTKDAVQWHEDGTLEFLGRTDNLVKVNGFRIEPAEVEATMLLHPAIADAVVLAPSDATGHKRLVGYFVCAPDVAGHVTAEVRDVLRERLPHYLVPTALVALERFPVNANGKLDRAALPTADDALPRRPYRAPRTPTEQELASLWSEVLGVDRVSIDDGFFAIGGHSLVATRVISRVNRRFGTTLGVRSMFDHDTLADLAAAIDAQLEADGDLADLLDRVGGLTDAEVARMLGDLQ